MNKLVIPLTVSLLAVLSGCVIQNRAFTNNVPIVDEAALLKPILDKKDSKIKQQEWTYIQPINKSISCKIPSSKDLVSIANHKLYWDGQCKNGFAYGIGQEYFRSPTFNQDFIINHGEKNTDNSIYFVSKDYPSPSKKYPSISYGRFLGKIQDNRIEEIRSLYEIDKDNNKYYKLKIFSFIDKSTVRSIFLNGKLRRAFYSEDSLVYLKEFASDQTKSVETIYIQDSNGSVSKAIPYVARKYKSPQGVSYTIRTPDGAEKAFSLVNTPYWDKVDLIHSVTNEIATGFSTSKAELLEKKYLDLVSKGKIARSGIPKKVLNLSTETFPANLDQLVAETAERDELEEINRNETIRKLGYGSSDQFSQQQNSLGLWQTFK